MPRGKWDMTQEAAEYRRNYNKEHYERVHIMVPKGTNERIVEAAKAAGLSKVAFIMEAVNEKIEKSAQGTK